MVKEIIMNEENLKDEEVNLSKNKSRLIIMNENNEILIQNYAGVYMLPGGKIDEGETAISGLTREIKEETGIDISNDIIIPFLKTKMYVRNYPNIKSDNDVNKLVETDYFYINNKKDIIKNEIKFTNNEKKHKLTMEFVDVNKVFEIIKSNPSLNPRKKYYDAELLEVLNEFLQMKKKEINIQDLLIDMHIHTCYSDGDFKPIEIVEKVKNAGIGTFSITDHDTILGCKQMENVNTEGLIYIPGVELTASVPRGRMHILGYNFDINNNKLNDLLKRKKVNSDLSIGLMYKYIHEEFGVVIPQFELDLLYKKIGNIGRPDLASLLRKYLYAKSNEEAFKIYLIEAFNATYSSRITTSKEECIKVLKEAGAYISLAHPISLELNYEELKKELIYLKKLGLDALEICHSNQPEEYRIMLRTLRDELNLYETAGSDYHGPTVQPGIEIGTGRNNNIKVKQLSLVDKIKS